MLKKTNINEEIPQSQNIRQMIDNMHKNFIPNSKHDICKEYIFQRKNIFHILHKIMTKMGFKSQVFFLSTHYLDIIFSSKKNIKIKINIYALALACLCISSKFLELDPLVPELYYFIRTYYNICGYKIKNPISLQDLKYAEVLVLKILDYKLNYYTIYDFNSFFFVFGILKSQQKNNDYKTRLILEKIYKKSRYYLDIISVNDILCFKYDSIILSICILEQSVKDILSNKNNMLYFDNRRKNKLSFYEIAKKYFNFNYEKNKQYQCLIIDEEIQTIFGKNKNEKEYKNDKNNQNSEEKNENYNNNVILNKSGLAYFKNKYKLNFDINKLRNAFITLEKNKSKSKEKNDNKKLEHLYSANTMKIEESNQNTTTNSSKNELYNNNLSNKFNNKSNGKNFDSIPQLKYSKYSYKGNEYNTINIDNKTNKKFKNSSVESRSKNINMNRHILTSSKKRNVLSLNFVGNSVENSSKNLYHKKLIYQKMNENHRTISSLMDDIKRTKITYGVIKMNQNKSKIENSIEYQNKYDNKTLQNNNLVNGINYQNIYSTQTFSTITDINNSINNENLNYNIIKNNSKNRSICHNNINDSKNINENAQTIEAYARRKINIKNTYIIKNLKDLNVNILNEKESKNFITHKYQKNKTKKNYIRNFLYIKDPYKNDLSYLMNNKNTNLNHTLKEIKDMKYNEHNKIFPSLINKKSDNCFKTNNDCFYKIKQAIRKEETIKNLRDRKICIPNIKQHAKINSSTIVINNNINFNIRNKNMIGPLPRYNNIDKKNRILETKSKNYFNINGRICANGLNETFYKSHCYTNTLGKEFN